MTDPKPPTLQERLREHANGKHGCSHVNAPLVREAADALDRAEKVTAGAHHARFGERGQFGWWVGVLRHWHADVWECGHQHEDRKRATACATKTLLTATGVIHEPIHWRPGRKRR